MFQTPTRKGFSVTPRVSFNKSKEKMSAPNNAEYYVRKAAAGLPNSQLLHPGSMIIWPNTTAPDDWLLCDGQAVSRTDFSDLFDEIGTTFGSGDGSTTFNLPNCKGRVVVGQDTGDNNFNTMGEIGGESDHTLLESEMPAHTHPPAIGAQKFVGSRTTSISSAAASPNTIYQFLSSTTGSTGGGATHENKQKYITINYIIKT